MKTLKKLILPTFLVFVALLVILVLERNFVARMAVEVGVTKVTGFPLEIDSVKLGLFSSKVDVHNLKLMNPPEFKEKMFVDMPQLYVDYRLGSMLKGAPHINDMLINIKHLVIVKNNKGETNAKKLKGIVSPGGGSSKNTASTSFVSTSASSPSRISAAPNRASATSPSTSTPPITTSPMPPTSRVWSCSPS